MLQRSNGTDRICNTTGVQALNRDSLPTCPECDAPTTGELVSLVSAGGEGLPVREEHKCSGCKKTFVVFVLLEATKRVKNAWKTWLKKPTAEAQWKD